MSKNRPKSVKPEKSVNFDFSDEALEAIKVVEMVRRHKGTTDTAPLVPRALLLKQRAEQMLGANLPTQASRFDAEFEANSGDTDPMDQLNEFLMARLGRFYAAAEKYAQQDGNPQLAEDYFQDIVERILGQLQTVGEGNDRRDIVNQALHRAHRDNRGNYHSITLSIEGAKMLQSIIDAKEDYFKTNNIMPTEKELVGITGLAEEDVAMLLGVHNMLSIEQVGLEIPEEYDSTEDAALDLLTLSLIHNSLVEHLLPREREILIARAEIAGHPPQTHEELGIKWNISRSRAAQIEHSAKVKLAENAHELRWWIRPEDSYLLLYRDRHVERDISVARNLMDQRRESEARYRRLYPEISELRDQRRTKNYILSRYKGGEDLGDLDRYTQGVKQVIVEAFEVQARRYLDFSIQPDSIYNFVDNSLHGKGLRITDSIPWTLIRKLTDELVEEGILTTYTDEDNKTRLRYTQIFEGPDQDIDKT